MASRGLANSTIAGPAALGGAALLAAGAWLAPVPRAAVPTLADITPAVDSSGGRQSPLQSATPSTEDWEGIAAVMATLRTPPREPDPEGPEGEGPRPPVPQVQVAWRYIGRLESSDKVRAVVSMNGAQRFVVEGGTYLDAAGTRLQVTVERITDTYIVLRVDGGEQRIELEERTPLNVIQPPTGGDLPEPVSPEDFSNLIPGREG